MTRSRRHWRALATILGTILVASACSSGGGTTAAPPVNTSAPPSLASAPPSAPPSEATVTTVDKACTAATGSTLFYTGSGDPPDQAKINAVFIKQHNITPNFIQLRSADAATRVMTEAQAGRPSQFDIVTGPMNDLMPLAASGLITTQDLRAIGIEENKVREIDGRQIVRVKRKFGGLMYNTSTTTPADLPDTWAGLVDPALLGKIMVDARGTYASLLVLGMGKEKYESFITDLVSTVKPVAVEGTTGQMQKVLVGEFLTGDAGQDSDIKQQAAKGAPIDIKFLDFVTTFDVYALLLDSARNPDAAICYINWLNSPEGLKILGEAELRGNTDLPPGGLSAGASLAAADTVESLKILAEAAKFVAGLMNK